MRSETANLIIVAHNLRSIYNAGSILRTCDGLGVEKFIATGTTPYPNASDTQLPHVVKRINAQISKTALGAEESVDTSHGEIEEIINTLKHNDFKIYALEQSTESINLRNFVKPIDTKIALIVGNENEGIASDILQRADEILEIPMVGTKESFNVASATAIALWQLTN